MPFHFGAETNLWPFYVGRKAPATPENPFAAAGPTQTWQAIGPLRFSTPLGTKNRYDDGSTLLQGIRPFYVEKRDAAGRLARVHILYPFFTWTRTPGGYRWDILNLVNHEHAPARNPTAARPNENQFDIWPFYFSRQTGDPATSYRAVFPLYGNNVSGHLLQDRLDWFLFPLYFRRTLNDVQRTSYLWPIVTRTTGGGYNGFAIWPLFGTLRKEGAVNESYFLWPIIHNSIRTDTDTGAVSKKFGVLPFYYREDAHDPGAGRFERSKSYMLFWGYTRRTAPGNNLTEHRYLWPLWLRVRGDKIQRDRFAPFYTRSVIKDSGHAKTWVMWPLWNQEAWNDGTWQFTKKRLFFFLYHDITQKPLPWPGITPEQKTKLAASSPARRANIWPLFSYWTDGHGHRQLQIPSPLEAILPDSEPMRQIYSPIFSLYRYEQAAPGHTRHSLLWNFITHRREPDLREFHLGPLYSGERVGLHKRRAIFCGVLGMQKTPEKGWRPFAFKFKSLQRQLAEKEQKARIESGARIAEDPAPPPEPPPKPAPELPRDYPRVRQRI